VVGHVGGQLPGWTHVSGGARRLGQGDLVARDVVADGRQQVGDHVEPRVLLHVRVHDVPGAVSAMGAQLSAAAEGAAGEDCYYLRYNLYWLGARYRTHPQEMVGSESLGLSASLSQQLFVSIGVRTWLNCEKK